MGNNFIIIHFFIMYIFSFIIIFLLAFSLVHFNDKDDFIKLNYIEVDPNTTISYPNSYFSGYFVDLQHQSFTNSSASAFSISSSKGMWMTSAHSVSNCKYVLLDIDGTDWEIIEKIDVHPNTDIAVLHSSISAPAFSFVSNDTWIPKSVYNVGYSSNSLNASWLKTTGWTISIDRDRDIEFPIIVWKPEIILDKTRITGLSGSPLIDQFGYVYGLVSSFNQAGDLGSVTVDKLFDILSFYNIKYDKINVHTLDDFDPAFLSKAMFKYEKLGSIKRLQCIRRADYSLDKYLKEIIKSE